MIYRLLASYVPKNSSLSSDLVGCFLIDLINSEIEFFLLGSVLIVVLLLMLVSQIFWLLYLMLKFHQQKSYYKNRQYILNHLEFLWKLVSVNWNFTIKEHSQALWCIIYNRVHIILDLSIIYFPHFPLYRYARLCLDAPNMCSYDCGTHLYFPS